MTINVFGPDNVQPLQEPGCCFICEGSPTQAVERVVDTFRHFITHVPTKLSGRKYVCESCIRELGKLIGFVDPSDYHALLEDFRKAEKHVADLMRKVQQLESVHVETLQDLLKQARKPATSKAPPVE